jgi:hypothetical protein
MNQRPSYRYVCPILPAGLLFVLAANTLLAADSLTITGTATSSTLAGINVGDQWTGTLTTDGSCVVCTPGNGLLSLSIDMYGDIFSASDVEGYPAFPSFDRTSGNLNLAASAGPFSDVIVIGAPTSGTFDLSRPEIGDVSGTFGVSGPSPCSVSTSNPSNFNGTQINPGAFIWFSSNFSVKGVGSQSVNIFFKNQTIQFAADKAYSLTVPNAAVTFDPSASCASTTFDTSSQTWRTVVPLSGSDEIFISGLAFPVPIGFSKVNGNVNWQGSMSSDTPGVGVQWKWGGAVYSTFPTDYNVVAPKAAHSNTCALNNSDHSGTPEGTLNGMSIKKFVTGGARGGGGSNFTGSWSGTVSVPFACSQ